jgi:hypothetical protein
MSSAGPDVEEMANVHVVEGMKLQVNRLYSISNQNKTNNDNYSENHPVCLYILVKGTRSYFSEDKSSGGDMSRGERE